MNQFFNFEVEEDRMRTKIFEVRVNLIFRMLNSD